MKRSVLVTLAIVMTLGSSACAKHDASTASSTTTDTAAASATDAAATDSASGVSPSSDSMASAEASPNATSSGATLTVGGSTIKTGSAAGTSDLPAYPGAVAKSDGAMDMVAAGVHLKMVSLTTRDAFDAVDAWYKSHLSSDYKNERIEANGAQASQYKFGDDNTLPMRLIDVTRGGANSKDETTIVLTLKEKS